MQQDFIGTLLSLHLVEELLSLTNTRWQCCSTTLPVSTCCLDQEERGKNRRKIERKDSLLLFMQPHHVAWLLEGISHSSALSQQHQQIMTLHIITNGAQCFTLNHRRNENIRVFMFTCVQNIILCRVQRSILKISMMVILIVVTIIACVIVQLLSHLLAKSPGHWKTSHRPTGLSQNLVVEGILTAKDFQCSSRSQ